MRADRVVSMMLLLEARGRMTAAQLADELGVSRRTVMRDIDALGQAGVPVYSTRGAGGGFHIWEGFRSQLRGISAEEAAALALVGSQQIAGQLGLGDAAARVRMKLENALTPELANEMATTNQRFHHDATPWREVTPHAALAFFEVAVRRRRVVRTSVRAEGAIEIRPIGLVLKAGYWYLVAESSDSKRRVLALADLSGYETTGQRFPYPEDFDLARFWKDYRAGPPFDAACPPRDGLPQPDNGR